jgi:antitoxin HigA-1
MNMSAKGLGKMKSAPHTGEVIRHEVIDALGLSVTAAAKVLGVSRPALSTLLNGGGALSWEMAIRIEKAFGPKADHLMRMQFAYDESRARAIADTIAVKPYAGPRL